MNATSSNSSQNAGSDTDAGRFDSPEQEIFLNLWRTYDCLKAVEDQLFSQHQISAQQYNALRLLRSVYPEAMQTLALFAELEQETPGAAA